MSDDPSQHKKQSIRLLLILLVALVLSIGIAFATTTDGKQDKTIKVDKIEKAEPMKVVNLKGKYAPTLLEENSTHYRVKGWYCTCGRYKWGRQKTILVEKTVRFTKNDKPIPRGKNYKINYYKLSFNKCGGEVNIRNKGTKYHDIDLCFCGREKSQRGKSWYQYYMKKLN